RCPAGGQVFRPLDQPFHQDAGLGIGQPPRQRLILQDVAPQQSRQHQSSPWRRASDAAGGSSANGTLTTSGQSARGTRRSAEPPTPLASNWKASLIAGQRTVG